MGQIAFFWTDQAMVVYFCDFTHVTLSAWSTLPHSCYSIQTSFLQMTSLMPTSDTFCFWAPLVHWACPLIAQRMLVHGHLLLEVRETTSLDFVPLKSLNKCLLDKWIEEWMNKWMNKSTSERKHIAVEIFRSQLQIGNNEIFACEISWAWVFDVIAKISWKECLMREVPRIKVQIVCTAGERFNRFPLSSQQTV